MFLKLWEFFFDPWEVTILKRGNENWRKFKRIGGITLNETITYSREFVEYKYSHKFYKKEKIVKKYLD